MSDKKKLSIITVCYNEKELERTCESIVNQTFQDFEWVVIDGGSNQETLDIFEKYKKRINIFVSEKDKGIYNAMNKGIKLSSGKWLNFMNAGDTFFENTTLEKIFIKNKNAFNNADIVYCDSIHHNSDGTLKINKFPDKLKYTFWQSDCLNHQAYFVKKILFEKFNLYNEEYRICADFEKLLLFLKEGCIFKHLKIFVSNFFMDGISSTGRQAMNKEKEKALAKYFPLEYKTIYTLMLFDKIPVMRIKKRRDNQKYAIILFKIPIFTWKPAEWNYREDII